MSSIFVFPGGGGSAAGYTQTALSLADAAVSDTGGLLSGTTSHVVAFAGSETKATDLSECQSFAAWDTGYLVSDEPVLGLTLTRVGGDATPGIGLVLGFAVGATAPDLSGASAPNSYALVVFDATGFTGEFSFGSLASKGVSVGTFSDTYGVTVGRINGRITKMGSVYGITSHVLALSETRYNAPAATSSLPALTGTDKVFAFCGWTRTVDALGAATLTTSLALDALGGA